MLLLLSLHLKGYETMPKPDLDPQHFQPVLLDWYDREKRDLPWRRTRDPYAVWISEAMLQQTRVETVIPYYHRFMKRFPDPAALASADLQEVLKLWEGLGYYSRARNLHRAAAVIVEEYDGRIPHSMDAIRSLPGVGPYIAAAVLSIAFDQPHAVVDGNVKRVLARLLQIDAPVNKPASHRIFQREADRLLTRERPSAHNQAIMELGALVCKPKNPECAVCPVSSFCRSHGSETVSAFPVRLTKPRTPLRRMIVAVIVRQKDHHVLIVQRPEEGLLGGLWEFPGKQLEKGRRAIKSCVEACRERTGSCRCNSHSVPSVLSATPTPISASPPR
jgi:A/G-specific adenine glycosylase